jgi:methyl-accepting chemotaxis protein/methyl-accepting chemotaxis protein-1 (serine sensor receptor)
MTIGKKLTITVGAMLALALILGVTSIRSIGQLADNLDTATNKTAKKLQLTGRIRGAIGDMTAGQRGFLLYTYAKRPAGATAATQMFQAAGEIWAQNMQEMRPMLATAEGKRLSESLDSDLGAWKSVLAEVEKVAGTGNIEAAMQLAVDKALPLSKDATKACNDLDGVQARLLATQQEEAASLRESSRWLAIALIALAGLAGAVTLFSVRRISQALQSAAAELGQCAEQVASASGQVASSSQSLAQGASEQAASLEETSASSEEITSMTRKNADNSRTAADLTAGTARVVDSANHSLSEMQTSMREINESSDKIGKIIKVIDEIAFQTNILALNAAVEAARAGEAGMGFAVVADEVRNLAQRSAQAAKDTAGLIEESISRSHEGRGKLEEVAGAISKITESAQKVNTLVDEVKLGSEEQARGIEQISKAIAQMEQVTQKSAANAEETASAGEEMSAQAEAMNTIVEQLRQMVGGQEGGSRARSSSMVSSRAAAAHTASRSVASDIHALSKSVSRSSAGAPKEPAVSAAARAKSAIPLDEDFKEF